MSCIILKEIARYILTVLFAIGIVALSVGFIALKMWGVQFGKKNRRK